MIRRADADASNALSPEAVHQAVADFLSKHGSEWARREFIPLPDALLHDLGVTGERRDQTGRGALPPFGPRTLHFYKTIGLVPPPVGVTNKAVYGPVHLIRAALGRIVAHIARTPDSGLRDLSVRLRGADYDGTLPEFVRVVREESARANERPRPLPGVAAGLRPGAAARRQGDALWLPSGAVLVLPVNGGRIDPAQISAEVLNALRARQP